MIGPSLIKLEKVVADSIRILSPVFGENAKEETFKIIADYLSIAPSKVRLDMQRITVDNLQEKELSDRMKRRFQREPLQYISGFTYFMGEKFLVGEGVLIPRSDTEILVEEAINITKAVTESNESSGFEFLEFCTGSGCIALSLIKKMKDYGVEINGIATDISTPAISYANKNAFSLECKNQIQILQIDMMSDMRIHDRQYQMILANPPYIKTEVISGLEPEVSSYEPFLALDGGIDGLKFYRRIMDLSRELLAPGGWILLEIGYDQENEILEIIEKTGILEMVAIKKDYGGNPRVAICRRKQQVNNR